MMLRVQRAVYAVGDIGNVHVCRWGDGSEHFHMWFMARPARDSAADRLVRRDLGRHLAAAPRRRLAREPRSSSPRIASLARVGPVDVPVTRDGRDPAAVSRGAIEKRVIERCPSSWSP